MHPAITQAHCNPREVGFSVYHAREKLEVQGQGTVGFSVNAKNRFRILFRSACSSLMVDIGENRTSFRVITKGKIDDLLYEVEKSNIKEDPFLDIGREQVYWLSIDKNNNLIRFGKGEMIAELCELEFNYSHLLEEGEMAWMSLLDSFSIAGHFSAGEIKKISHTCHRLPVTTSAPPVIVAHNQINLGLIDNNEATVVNNLSNECAQLYNNVAGQNLSLNTPDFPDFSDAINWSIMTEGALCHTRLLEKAAGLSERHKKQCYLRITIGENLGDSPGAPYVLEIWPGQHYSPVHRHAECNAIIKVLHGSLSCRWFKSLQFEENMPYQQTALSAGQVTWLDPKQFQTHQLYNHNIEGNMCATIQCYKYSKIDFEHYEYFDYRNEDSQKICQFTPKSDWRYSRFKEQVRAEWEAYKSSARGNNLFSEGKSVNKNNNVKRWH
ncbi:hypothetical protein MNBD_GAMMA06-392 [hydrothermal vent metagenome]|uniref:Cysteine dioxygenase n=1 Tax=hydrothermal vent metagenome TaxID=652676 RepID=A0A3B0X4G0_9ZZZZ